MTTDRCLSFKVLRYATVVLAGTVVGCGNEPVIEGVPAAATVSMDGKPLDGVSVTLVPQEKVAGNGGYGRTDGGGKVSLRGGPRQQGVSPGKYRVLFQKLTMPDGSPIPEGAMAADVQASNELPPLYNSPERSPVLATIPAEGTTGLSFDLQSNLR